jgi:hypothetical protein
VDFFVDVFEFRVRDAPFIGGQLARHIFMFRLLVCGCWDG